MLYYLIDPLDTKGFFKARQIRRSLFLRFKEFELLERCLFPYFHDFWSQIGVVILVTPKQEVERKSKWFCGVKFFRFNFKVESEFAFSLVFMFTCRISSLIFNSRTAIAGAIIGLLLVFFTTRRGVLVFSRFFFTGSRFVHAAFWPKSKSEKSCLGEQIFAKREKFLDHALRLVNDFLTLKSSWLNCTYRWPFLAVFSSEWPNFFAFYLVSCRNKFYSILYWNVNFGNWYHSVWKCVSSWKLAHNSWFFWLIFGFFNINFFIFGSIIRLFVKNQLIWQLLFDISYTQRLFLSRCNFVS